MRGTRGIIEIGHHNRMTVSNTAFPRDIQQSREAEAVLFCVFRLERSSNSCFRELKMSSALPISTAVEYRMYADSLLISSNRIA